MTTDARGTFDVTLTPQPPDSRVGAETLDRFSLDKQFHGDLEATSVGQMLAAGTDVEGSAGYVAMERVIGTLHGRRGSFVLQHNGVMNRGEGQLTITVVPDSGTDELVGLVGEMMIIIEDGAHRYRFDYALDI